MDSPNWPHQAAQQVPVLAPWEGEWLYRTIISGFFLTFLSLRLRLSQWFSTGHMSETLSRVKLEGDYYLTLDST